MRTQPNDQLYLGMSRCQYCHTMPTGPMLYIAYTRAWSCPKCYVIHIVNKTKTPQAVA